MGLGDANLNGSNFAGLNAAGGEFSEPFMSDRDRQADPRPRPPSKGVVCGQRFGAIDTRNESGP